jgi:MscS family membrane protein
VEHIGWRLTRIRTFDKRPLYVPNGVFANIALENPQRMTNRRIYETIGVRYEDASKMEEIIRKVKDMLINHPEIDTEKTLIVNLVSFAPSSLDFFIYTFTKTTNWIFFHEVKQDIMLKVLTIINDEGAQTAYPTSTIHLPEANHLSK